MDEKKNITVQKSTSCPWCNGTGQISYFGGESRFMFTWEDCSDCCGTGLVFEAPEEKSDNAEKG